VIIDTIATVGIFLITIAIVFPVIIITMAITIVTLFPPSSSLSWSQLPPLLFFS
jgi:hypothetical protein